MWKPLLSGLVAGRRYDLARAITLGKPSVGGLIKRTQSLLTSLAESTRADHRLMTRDLLQGALAAKAATRGGSLRIGLSGSPGVGKSTLIEALGLHIVGQGHKVAVLAVDPSSALTGGSILGDKTRMLELSRHDNAYVRPSPSRGTLGGVARNTNEAIILCEAAGYDIVLIETVGVGQSETIVADMVDLFVLLVPPAGGDELQVSASFSRLPALSLSVSFFFFFTQGIKRGIMELADLILVTKADGDLVSAARNAQLEYTSALKFMHPRSDWWKPKVMSVSSVKIDGIAKAWEEMQAFHRVAVDKGAINDRRGEQNKTWMWRQVQHDLMSRLESNVEVHKKIRIMSSQVYSGQITPGQAADDLVQTFLGNL